MADNKRDLALFNMAIDCKLRGCDLVCLKVNDVYATGRVKERASVRQSKTRKPVRFEITETTRLSVDRWIKDPEMIGREYLWPSRVHSRPHLLTRQYARIMRDWVLSIGLEPSAYGTHSMRRTKVAQIYKKTGVPDPENPVSKKVLRPVRAQQVRAANPLFRCFRAINDAQ